MLLVKTKVLQSKIHGLGLFADEFIPKGTITWRFDPQIDLYFEPEEVAKMTELKRSLIEHFAYLSQQTGKYVYSVDNTRFTNHSAHPNINNTKVLEGDREVCGEAKRDIAVGEELTIDYRLVDANDEKSKEAYLN
ncbi:MAG: Nuclear protein SET [Parcubacteria group bacterium GW2011_GWA2_49_9]|nr:MAG: Nuclear protein SET [Parcubacteria group bacterium GW2011_GWA2_49_9]